MTRPYEIRTTGNRSKDVKFRLIVLMAEDVSEALQRFETEYRRNPQETVLFCRAVK